MDSGPAPRQMDAGVVSPLQLRVAQIVGRGVPDYGKGFADAGLWLDGGTALASYYLAHRESDDLDFFGDPSMHAGDVAMQMRLTLELEGLTTEPASGSSVAIATFIVRGTGERSDRPLVSGLPLKMIEHVFESYPNAGVNVFVNTFTPA
ncbi:MAG: nucleotidyl transferase AbiEii/AbiGii toxin family protein [Gemmatimonadaceae bacterium]